MASESQTDGPEGRLARVALLLTSEKAARLEAASFRIITTRQCVFHPWSNGDDGPIHNDGLDPIHSDDLGHRDGPSHDHHRDRGRVLG
jgi:hypothetical protein